MMASIFVKVDTDDVMMILGQSGKNNYLWSTHSLSLVHAKNKQKVESRVHNTLQRVSNANYLCTNTLGKVT